MTRAGLILGDRYRLDEQIAAGGVGQVWRATDLLLGRAVAVKVLRPEYADHSETLERFRKEARHTGAISNAHVAQLYDYGPMGPDGSPYLVMEYVDGPSLAAILAVDSIEPVRALDIISQAADGLAAAHKAGLVHRDVKPGNILIGPEGQVKVTDFGIAHAAGQPPVTRPGLVMGTTQYMAPERIAGSHGTAASDVYALGIVLHECLTGVPPHDGNLAEVMAAHLYLPLPPLPSGTPPEVEDLVARLTVKDPAGRISDARELSDLAAMLRDSLSGVPHVPPARTGAHPVSGTAVASSVLQVGALAADPGPALAGSGLASPAFSHAATYGLGPDSAARGSGGGSTSVLPPPHGHGGPAGYVSDEWRIPERMSLPADPSRAFQPRPPQRRKGTAVAVGAAVAASAGLLALLLSGAFNGTPAANQGPAGTPTTNAPTFGKVPSPNSSKGATPSAPASGIANPASGTTAPGTSGSPAAAKGAAKPSGSPSARPSGSSSGPTGGTPSPTPTSTAPSPTPSFPTSITSAPPASPTNSSPASNAPTTPAPAPSTIACLLTCL